MESNIHEHLRKLISDRFLQPGSPAPSDDTPLFTSGLIDSFGVLELIVELEEAFEIQIDTASHEIREFDTIEKIVQLIDLIRSTQ
jgi:acyl carrier protein